VAEARVALQLTNDSAIHSIKLIIFFHNAPNS
jgi:hypothetical protein